MEISIRSQDLYSPQLVAECLLRHYELLANLHMDLLRELDRSDSVIELFRCIPYLKDGWTFKWEVYFNSYPLSYLKIGAERLVCLTPYETPPPPDVICLTWGRYATVWSIDTKNGHIIPADGFRDSDAPEAADGDPWRCRKPVPIKPYFDDIYHNLRRLAYVPYMLNNNDSEGRLLLADEGDGKLDKIDVGRSESENQEDSDDADVPAAKIGVPVLTNVCAEGVAKSGKSRFNSFGEDPEVKIDKPLQTKVDRPPPREVTMAPIRTRSCRGSLAKRAVEFKTTTETAAPIFQRPSVTTRTITCDGGPAPQACLHYSSVIIRDPDLRLLTCDGLHDNPCPPRQLVEAPGFALLTNDQWYQRNSSHNKYRSAYKKPPTGPLARRDLADIPSIDELYVVETNTSRRTTSAELRDDFGLVQYANAGCSEEMGHGRTQPGGVAATSTDVLGVAAATGRTASSDNSESPNITLPPNFGTTYLTTWLALWSTTITALPVRPFVRDVSLSLDGNSVGYNSGTDSVTTLDPTIDPTSGLPATPSGDSDVDSDSDEVTDETTEIDSQEATTTTPDKIRGVNLGGWLLLEKWMTPEVFTGAFAEAKDQYTFDQIEGSQEALEKHWSTYITEQDIAKIASWGINTLRIPIGYWAYNHSDDTPYKTGADKYLKDALEWSRNNNLQVLIDLHGVPGSQNGFDNSGQAGQALWQKDNNMDAAVSALKQITSIYGTEEYSDVVWGIQLVNEPICWSNNIDPQKTHDWAKSTFQYLTSAEQVPYKIIMHDAFEGPKKWADLGKELNSNTASDPAFWIDTHLYQNQVDEDSQLTQEQHIEKACKWSSTNLIPDETQVPVIVGEFSAQTNVCVNPDGSSIAGKQCSTEGCQCSVDDMNTWRQPMKDATTKFLEAELDTFEASAAGWFLWSYKAPGTWGLANLMEHGILGETVTDRKFPGQCQQYSSA
ncbi:hypothetical protein KVT40_006276 [Elsinoe batatas]|uniref:glucan 1,3-beta-glucosidase n=1 Tax=Elsinoe batatas TaxID=2601811 RepID=A0A8K0PBK1_9PEZI|nr:hypothetical protein KVT40_006276 [Elsinoe batatas]